MFFFFSIKFVNQKNRKKKKKNFEKKKKKPKGWRLCVLWLGLRSCLYGSVYGLRLGCETREHWLFCNNIL